MSSQLFLDIADRLKREIIGEAMEPGQRLPTRVELERRFATTPMTLNRAMKVLVEEGFVQTRMGFGTHVAACPPHLTHFALAFPLALEHVQSASRFYEALCHEAAKLQSDERRVSVFYGIESHVDVEDYQRLLGFVRAHRLAGLIFASNPRLLALTGSPLFHEPGLLRTAITLPERSAAFPTVYPAIDAFLPKAFDYLASRGRKQVAVVQIEANNWVDLPAVQALAAERGLMLRPHWLQASSPDVPNWSRQLALLLLQGPPVDRPDAVVITDDNLVEGFTAGIRDSEVRVVAGDEPIRMGGLEVVAQANFPYPTRSAVPAKRLGYSTAQLMSVCLERIEQQRRGEDVPPHTAIPAIWEDEAASGKGEHD